MAAFSKEEAAFLLAVSFDFGIYDIIMNMDEEKLEKQFKDFQEVAKENKNVDVAALMVSALQVSDSSKKTSGIGSRRWAYLISLGAPPFGLFFVLKYYFGDDEDGRQAAFICVILTLIGGVLAWVLFSSVLSSSHTSLQQIEQITPSEINSTLK